MKSDTSSSDTTPANSTTENSPATDSTSSESVQDYYRYRYEPIDSQYGKNQNSPATEDPAPSASDSTNTDATDTENRGDSATMNDEGAADETPHAAGSSTNASMADAVAAVVSRWVEDFSSDYGLKVSQVMDLLAQMK